MTDFFENMWKRYRPDMSRKDFSDLMNDLENPFFKKHPHYLELSEIEQDRLIEQEYRRVHGH